MVIFSLIYVLTVVTVSCNDVILQALEGFPSTSTRDVFRDTLLNSHFYYPVRIQAGQSLAKVRLYSLALRLEYRQDRV